MNTTHALILVDVQYDFMEGGSLAVAGGLNVATSCISLASEFQKTFRPVFATQDAHIDPGDHFSEAPDFVDSWPPHCVKGTHGYNVYEGLHRLTTDLFEKGHYTAAYSGFEGANLRDESLDQVLKSHLIETVTVVGLATDYCVKATALDAARLGYRVMVDLRYCAHVNVHSRYKALAELRAAGVDILGER